MEDTFCHAAHDFGLSSLQRSFCGILVTGGDRLFNFTQERPDARTTGFVYCKATLILTGAFLAWGEFAMVFDPCFGARCICIGRKFKCKGQTRSPGLVPDESG